MTRRTGWYLDGMPVFRDDSSAEIAAALGSLPTGSAVSVVATRLLDLFTSGSIPPGTRLPPERQLAASLEVGRSAVREALAALEILGIVDVRPGSGTYLRGTVSELLPQSLSWGVLLGERNTAELLELRSGLEIYVARLAAERLTDAQLTNLRRHLDVMRVSIDDLKSFVKSDLAFHHDLASAAENRLLLDLLQVVRSLLRVWVERAVEEEGHARAALEEHEAVYRALAARDGDAAASAMAAHMTTASARLASAGADGTGDAAPGAA
ncbi:FadR/GntR family transcriptional regulator [Agromyces neolithicus]|uniref:FadR/GntR family transcriptional regulator n=2 Tax=Agromyces neolithicus TaxID=269420 RepID=A0ABP4Y9Q8_9MICO